MMATNLRWWERQLRRISEATYQKVVLGLLGSVVGSFIAGYNINAYFDARDGKILLKQGEFLTLSDVDKSYLPLDEVAKYYVLKSELSNGYVTKQEYTKVTQERDVLKAQAEELARIPETDSKEMTSGESWTSDAPPFVIKFGKYGFASSYMGAEVGTHFVDGEASWYTIDKFDKPRDWTFTSRGQKYQITAILKRRIDEPYLHVVWKKI